MALELVNKSGYPIDVLHALEKAARTPDIHEYNFEDVFSRDAWVAGQNRDIKRFSGGHRVKLVDAQTVSQLMTQAFEMEMIVSMLKTLTTTAVEIHEQYKLCLAPVLPKISKGLASLPDDLLPNIFKLAVQEEGPCGARQALWLSHVSERYRRIALAERELWTVLRTNAPEEQVETFLSRSGTNTGLHIFVDVTPDNRYSLNGFLDFKALRSTLHRWRVLSMTENDGYSEYSEFARKVMYELCVVFGGSAPIQLPNCRELNLDAMWFEERDTFSFKTPPWGAFQVLRCRNFLPAPSPFFSSLSVVKFEVTREFRTQQGYLNSLRQFLAHFSNITEMKLVIDPIGLGYVQQGEEVIKPTCASLKKFILRILRLRAFSGSQHVVESALQVLQMQQVEHVEVDIEFRGPEKDDYDEIFGRRREKVVLDEVSSKLFPDDFNHKFPNVSFLSLKLTTRPNDTYKYISDLRSEVLPIPLDRIPSVSTLVISTFTPLSLVPGDKDRIRSDGQPSNLREIRFVGCENVKIDAFRESIGSLKGSGVWDRLERVVVDECDGLEYDEVLDVVGKDKLRFL